MPYDKTPINLTHHNLTKKNIKKVAKKTTDAAIDAIYGPLTTAGNILGVQSKVRNKIQSFKNKKNRALGLGVNYKEAYVDADKNKYPTLESFTEAAKAYNNSPTKMNYDSPMKAGHSPMKAGHSPMKAGHSPMKAGHSPMEMQGSFMSKHSSSALHMGYSPMKMENVIDRDAKSSGKNQYNKYGK